MRSPSSPRSLKEMILVTILKKTFQRAIGQHDTSCQSLEWGSRMWDCEMLTTGQSWICAGFQLSHYCQQLANFFFFLLKVTVVPSSLGLLNDPILKRALWISSPVGIISSIQFMVGVMWFGMRTCKLLETRANNNKEISKISLKSIANKLSIR